MHGPSQCSTMPVTVCIPVFNEEANLPALLDALLAQAGIAQIIAVDDCSTDTSPGILAAYAARDSRVSALRNAHRSGQLAGWLLAARRARVASVVFIDADSRPAPGAIESLARAVAGNVVIASGRVVPASFSSIPSYARFRANIIHRVRSLGYAKEAIIGRFFAVDRDWFVGAVGRTDIIANDVYLSCLARRQQRESVYVLDAVCYYGEASNLRDFAAQRQRADAGYAQLRAVKLLLPPDEPKLDDYARCFILEALADPVGAVSWLRKQIATRFTRAYDVREAGAGTWETQPSTKHRVDA